MVHDGLIYFARKGGETLGDKICMRPDKANRHGFICGATGTGKSVTLKVLAEGFSEAGVPVFMADVKGDVTGMAQAGAMSDGLRKRLGYFGLAEEEVRFTGAPCRIWDMPVFWPCKGNKHSQELPQEQLPGRKVLDINYYPKSKAGLRAPKILQARKASAFASGDAPLRPRIF